MFAAIVLASEKPNGVVLPGDINEVIWSSLAFVLVVALIWWKGGPAIKDMWNGRVDRIKGEIDSAETDRREAEAELGDVQTRIANVDVERQRIAAEAQQTAQALGVQIAERTERDVADVGVRATADSEAARSQATADLRAEIGELAVGAAEEVVHRSLDDETRQQLIEAYIADVGARA